MEQARSQALSQRARLAIRRIHSCSEVDSALEEFPTRETAPGQAEARELCITMRMMPSINHMLRGCSETVSSSILSNMGRVSSMLQLRLPLEAWISEKLQKNPK
jgi:hypothetical protein